MPTAEQIEKHVQWFCRTGADPQYYRDCLTDRDAMLASVCRYAEETAARKRVPAWSILGEILGHGSGVSSAIYDLYRERPPAEKKPD